MKKKIRAKKPRYTRITKRQLFARVIYILIPILNLEKWNIHLQFTKRMKNLADCEAEPEYKEAWIRVNYVRLRDKSYHEIVGLALHELLHTKVWMLSGWAETLSRKNPDKMKVCSDLEEGLTTDIEQILFPLISPIVYSKLRDMGYVNIDNAPLHAAINDVPIHPQLMETE